MIDKGKKTVTCEGEILSSNEGQYQVRIETKSACARCHARGFCTTAESGERIVTCVSGHGEFCRGERVRIEMEERMGMTAVFYAFVLPFLLMVGILVLLKWVGQSDRLAGLASVLSLVPYYFLLHRFSPRLTRGFVFKISKIS